MMQPLQNKSILLIISGGIAAYKSLELIRLIKKAGGHVRCIITQGGQKFVTPLSAAALSEETVYTDLWSLKDETEMGHIRLSREADLIVVAPASANLIAQMAYGLAEDLASTALLAANKPILIAPAMNHMMWSNAATQDNIQTLKSRGIQTIGPNEGAMACGEHGPGRMAEPEEIMNAIFNQPSIQSAKQLKGLKALVTSGPTREPIDPVRFIANRSSGKQGHAIAAALARAGADVTLICGPVSIPDPQGIKTIHVESAADMLAASENALPSDIAVCAAAVSDWSPEKRQAKKIKKGENKKPPSLKLKENPDILHTLANHKHRPSLVIGFAAETNDLEANAKAKLKSKKCDWILANDISENTFGSDQNHVYLITSSNVIDWKPMSKKAIADKLVEEIINHTKQTHIREAAE